MEAFVFLQTDDNSRELRSRLETFVNVPLRVRLRAFLRLQPFLGKWRASARQGWAAVN